MSETPQTYPAHPLGPLAGLPVLHSLSASENFIVDVTPLAGMPALSELFLTANDIVDVAPLAAVPTLTRLYLDYNPVQQGMDALATLPALQVLDVSATGLTQLFAFSPATLSNLDAADNAIVDVAPLLGYAALHSINLANNDITTIAPIVDAPWLVDCVHIAVNGNPLDAESLDVLIPALCGEHAVVWGNFEDQSCECPPP